MFPFLFLRGIVTVGCSLVLMNLGKVMVDATNATSRSGHSRSGEDKMFVDDVPDNSPRTIH